MWGGGWEWGRRGRGWWLGLEIYENLNVPPGFEERSLWKSSTFPNMAYNTLPISTTYVKKKGEIVKY